MKVKRGRNTVVLNTENIFARVAQQLQAKANEMLKAKERELTLTIQEKDLRIKELELESKQKNPHDVVPSDTLTAIDMGTLATGIQRTKHNWSSCWRDLGSQLGFTADELDKISNMSGNPLFDMLYDWGLWYPGDSRGSTEFPTYSGLQSALVRSRAGDAIHHINSYNELLTYRPKR